MRLYNYVPKLLEFVKCSLVIVLIVQFQFDMISTQYKLDAMHACHTQYLLTCAL